MIATLIHRYCSAMLLLLCLVLGGASGAGFVANAALQLVAILAIALVLAGGGLPRLPIAARTLLALIALAAAVMLIQLLPLPPQFWSLFPGRAEVVRALALTTTRLPWLPISLSPDATIAALLSLLPVLAIILAVFASSEQGRRNAIHVLIGLALISVVLGIFQMAGDPESILYPYAITNRGSAVGFFANRNHLGTLLLCALPFLTATAVERGQGFRRRIGQHLLIGAAALVLLSGVIMLGSVAAAALLAPTLPGCGAIALHASRRAISRAGKLALVTAILLCALATPIAAIRFDHAPHDPSPQHRSTIVPTTFRAALDYLPMGSGGGSFQQIYPSREDPEAAAGEYVNHAHSDYAEVLLEYGLPGALLMVSALVLWASRARALWQSRIPAEPACAAFVALGIVIVHSCVDYPLRTAAIAALAGLSAALAVAPEPLVVSEVRRKRDRGTVREPSLSVMLDKG